MALTNRRLHSLPDEILATILTYTDTSAVLKLSSTSTRFRDICFQPFVFRHQIHRQQSIYLPDCEPAEVNRYVDRLHELRDMSTAQWARFAYIEELLHYLLTDGFSALQSGLVDKRADVFERLDWLSRHQLEIVANRHPCLSQWSFKGPLVVLFRSSAADKNCTLPGSLGLLAVACTLANSDDVISFDTNWFDIAASTQCKDYWLSPGEESAHIPDDAQFGTLLATLSRLVFETRCAAQSFAFLEPPLLSTIQMPSSWRLASPAISGQAGGIVLTTAAGGRVPPESCERATPKAGRSLYSQIVVPDAIPFITSASWTGYYTYGIKVQALGPRPVREAPMRNIRFRITKESDKTAQIAADGCSDGIAPFELLLEVSKLDGRFRGVKRYTAASRRCWDWFGMVTPFGIFAAWGPDGCEGYVWLWKES